jgi:hypothetical protein
MPSSINSTYLEIDVEDDWGFYIDIEAHDWNQIGASAPIKIQVRPIESINNGRSTRHPTNEEIQRLIKLSSPKEKNDEQTHATRFNLNITKTIAITVAAAAVCAFY